MLYLFLLLAMPTSPTCALVMNHAPVPNDFLPPICPIGAMPNWDWYNLRLISEGGVMLCEWPASQSLSVMGCIPQPADFYRIEVWLNTRQWVCNVKTTAEILPVGAVAVQCPDWLEVYQAGLIEVRGPYEVKEPAPVEPACTLPQVDNSAPIATKYVYQFLAGRLSWWGISISALEWQNRFDARITAAAIAAGVPAGLLKGMIARESQFWPLWSGDAREVGWMQLTWDGADTALRHDPELFARYCPLAIWLCGDSYDLLLTWQRSAVRLELIKDLKVSGWPTDAADMAAADLWTYAHILRAYACQALAMYPGRDLWETAAILYNAGSACIRGDSICLQGRKYLSEVMKYDRSNSIQNYHPIADRVR